MALALQKPKTTWKRQLIKLPFLLLLPIALILKEFAAGHSVSIEQTYSERIYPVLSQAVGFLFGWMPFSAAEAILYLGSLALIVYVLFQLVQLIRKEKRLLRACTLLLNLGLIAAVGYFLFIALWGLNYYRQPLASELEYQVTPRSVADLKYLCTNLASRANTLRPELQQDEKGDFRLSAGKQASLKKVPDAYSALSADYPLFATRYGPPKPILLSRLMSYTQTSGIFIPFTIEPNVNADMPDALFYATACHEAAHQHGFAREDEANFISYLACNASGDPEMEYSGTLLALIMSTNALYTYDSHAYSELFATLDAGVVRDIREDGQYWKQFDGPVAETSTKVNNAYLKSNKQADGVNSYGRMVDLLLAQLQKKGELPSEPKK